jgi:proteic killer suppression protein
LFVQGRWPQCASSRADRDASALPWITWSVILSWVIVSFRDKGTEDLFDGRESKQARKSCPSDLVRVARRELDQLNQAVAIGDLRAPPSNRLEKLKGEREGRYSIRINDQWRVCFRWTESGAEDVEVVDYH